MTSAYMEGALGDVILVNGAPWPVLRFRVARQEKESSDVPARLSNLEEFEHLDESAADRTRRFRFVRSAIGGQTMWTINGEGFDPDLIQARPELGSTEISELITDVHHPVHLHLVHFKVLSRSGQPPLARDAGWKDTVDVPPGQVARVLVHFDGYRGKYVFRCHNLEHEDMMMMANFEVV
ncbi:MAG: multicopper oxidase domain-containing protein [Microlunatus sp.]|nr:multicopper oxidase domain-containing protein [Microlunatus sp.]MDN5772043.1 multicopper oxidase domain-containing protein [Microlunatus sp.]